MSGFFCTSKNVLQPLALSRTIAVNSDNNTVGTAYYARKIPYVEGAVGAKMIQSYASGTMKFEICDQKIP